MCVYAGWLTEGVGGCGWGIRVEPWAVHVLHALVPHAPSHPTPVRLLLLLLCMWW